MDYVSGYVTRMWSGLYLSDCRFTYGNVSMGRLHASMPFHTK